MSSHVSRSALLPYAAGQIYTMVNDLEQYPKFLPWCSAARVLEHKPDMMRARLTLSKAGISPSFITRNTLTPNARIDMQLEEGPFSYLEGAWVFTALSDNASKIALDLRFDYDGPITHALLGPIFNHASSTMVDAFCQRAKVLYG